MNPHFMSLGMILTYPEHEYLGAMDVLAASIATETENPEPHPLIAFMFKPPATGATREGA